MSSKHTLSKSDFKLGMECWTKLYYKKLGYRSASDGNDYLGFLAEGGYLIGAVAKLTVPGGIDVQQQAREPNATYQETTKRALALTKELLQRDEVTLYEPAFQVGQRIVRVDILVKKKTELDLIEVKSKSQDGDKVKWDTTWGPYLDDVAFQLLVVRADRPDCQVTPWLMTPDKAHVATIDHLTSYFQLRKLGSSGNFLDVDIVFTGESVLAEQIRQCGLLRLWDVKELVANRLDDVERDAQAFEAWLGKAKLKHPKTPINKACFGCEYDATGDDGKNGFHTCWGELAKPERHIRQLYRVGSLGGHINPRANQWIDERRVDHDDLTEVDLVNADGQLGVYGERMLIQITHTKTGTEWLDENLLRDELKSWQYPLHFIDFEASSSPLPYHQGMRPYETVVFQWSCHTIATPGAEPAHQEFLNTTAHYPAIDFLQSLRAAIGSKGTALMWSHYERTQLRNLRIWLTTNSAGKHDELLAWVDELINDNRGKSTAIAPRLIDQHALVPKYWFHPRMAGRTSIKVALPAALAVAPIGRIDKWLRDVGLLDPQTGSRPDNPYLLLPSLDIPGLGSEEDDQEQGTSVTDGVAAMSAYQDMIYGRYMNNPKRHMQISDALRRYCRLDTLAQVIIWEHWRTRLGL